MDDSGASAFLVLVLTGIIGLVVFYFIVKAAVRNGMLEAHALQKRRQPSPPERRLPDGRGNSDHLL